MIGHPHRVEAEALALARDLDDALEGRIRARRHNVAARHRSSRGVSMPELPEVEGFRAVVEEHVVGRTIDPRAIPRRLDAEGLDHRRRPARRMKGRRSRPSIARARCSRSSPSPPRPGGHTRPRAAFRHDGTPDRREHRRSASTTGTASCSTSTPASSSATATAAGSASSASSRATRWPTWRGGFGPDPARSAGAAISSRRSPAREAADQGAAARPVVPRRRRQHLRGRSAARRRDPTRPAGRELAAGRDRAHCTGPCNASCDAP